MAAGSSSPGSQQAGGGECKVLSILASACTRRLAPASPRSARPVAARSVGHDASLTSLFGRSAVTMSAGRGAPGA